MATVGPISGTGQMALDSRLNGVSQSRYGDRTEVPDTPFAARSPRNTGPVVARSATGDPARSGVPTPAPTHSHMPMHRALQPCRDMALDRTPGPVWIDSRNVCRPATSREIRSSVTDARGRRPTRRRAAGSPSPGPGPAAVTPSGAHCSRAAGERRQRHGPRFRGTGARVVKPGQIIRRSRPTRSSGRSCRAAR